MRKQPVSVSVSRGFFGHERGIAKIGMQRPLLWHIQLKLRSFFLLSPSQIYVSLRRFLIPTTNKWPEWYDEMIFLQVLEKVECHQETAKKYCQSHAGRLD
jgi:hypothetical protein